MSVLDSVVEFVKVVASEVAGPSHAVLHNVSGAPAFRFDATAAEGREEVTVDEDDSAGEQATSQSAYQALGVVARPLAPDADGYAEAAALRTSDGLETIAYRDLRLNQSLNPTGAGTAPAEGQVMVVGYGGAFLSHRLTDVDTGTKRGNVTTIYVPHDFDADGVPQKAHAIVVDPTPGNSSIHLAHADGAFLALTEDVGTGEHGITMAVGDESFCRLSESELVLQAPRIMLKGVVSLGAQAEAGVPLLAGAASPPCPSLFVSPV